MLEPRQKKDTKSFYNSAEMKTVVDLFKRLKYYGLNRQHYLRQYIGRFNG